VTLRALARVLALHLGLTVALCAIAHRAGSLRPIDGVHISSAWRAGELVERVVKGRVAARPGVEIVDEHVIGEGTLFTAIPAAFALALVPGRDGVEASYDGVTAYATPDDLLSRQAYDKGIAVPGLPLTIGADLPVVEAILAERLGVTVPDLLEKGTLRRIRTERAPGLAEGPYIATKPEEITPDLLRGAAVDAARYLARGVGADGRFRYIVDAPTNRTLPGYDWPRHAGAAYLLAQASSLADDAELRDKALRTTALLRDNVRGCGDAKCVASDNLADLGTTALAIVAMTEIARAGTDPSYGETVRELSKFLRAQQRPDGEFMHFFDRSTNRPIDQQVLYYSGEATLALARAHTVTGDPADLEAARRGLAHLVGPAWSFFGARYYFGEEHWTCQAMADLWDRAPDPDALDFCERWRAYDARMMHAPGETPFDADGSFGVGPLLTPRLTPVASRTEAGVATLDVMLKTNADPAKRAALASELRRSFALLLRQQLRPGLAHLLAAPRETYGAIPGSEVDWQLRVDYAQHAGSAMIRGAAVTGM
jgi:hypothetical protein